MIIEETVLTYLDDEFGNCYAEKPEKPSGSYKVIEKTGGTESDTIRSATIAVQCIESSLYAAAQASEAVVRYMCDEFPYDAEVFSCKLVSAYNFTDSRTKEYRYQAIFQIYY